MTAKITIPGTLPGLNEYIDQCRRNPHAGASLKRTEQTKIEWIIRQQCRCQFKKPVVIHYHFVEPTRRRDKSNVAGMGIKLIEDALVTAGVLTDDGWKYIEAFSATFELDRKNARIEVAITDELLGKEEPKID